MKPLSLLCITAASLLIFACGQSSTEPPAQTPTSAPDTQATAAANAQATAEVEAAIAANVQATLEAQPTQTPVPPTSTPEPTQTPVPPTSTPEPTQTPVPPTSTPEPTQTPVPPTSTPEPTRTPVPPTSTPTPEPTNTPEPTPTYSPTPVPVGDRPDRAFAFQQFGIIANTDPELRLRVQRVLWGDEAVDDIQDYNERYNIEQPRGYRFVIVRLQITNDGDVPGSYDALSRLKLVSAAPDNEFLYELGDGLKCDEIRRPFRDNQPIGIDPNKEDDEDHTEQGHVCFVVKIQDAGDAILIDNGSGGAPQADWRYWKLRGVD